MIDLDRLARAIHLDDVRCGYGTMVSGGSLAHRVDDGGTCDCRDFEIRGGPCKHVLAVLLRNADAEVLKALRGLVPMPTPVRHRVGVQSSTGVVV
jgi:hypothetical protein